MLFPRVEEDHGEGKEGIPRLASERRDCGLSRFADSALEGSIYADPHKSRAGWHLPGLRSNW
jgi:hypothetical protein